MKDIKILNIPHLKAFIHTRMFENVKIPRNVKFKRPKKGTINEAKAGIKNLISMAYNIWCEEVIMKLESNNETLNVTAEENESDQPILINVETIF